MSEDTLTIMLAQNTRVATGSGSSNQSHQVSLHNNLTQMLSKCEGNIPNSQRLEKGDLCDVVKERVQ